MHILVGLYYLMDREQKALYQVLFLMLLRLFLLYVLILLFHLKDTYQEVLYFFQYKDKNLSLASHYQNVYKYYKQEKKNHFY